eukprot:5104423-Prorocentrum_lima.AAC.1
MTDGVLDSSRGSHSPSSSKGIERGSSLVHRVAPAAVSKVILLSMGHQSALRPSLEDQTPLKQ